MKNGRIALVLLLLCMTFGAVSCSLDREVSEYYPHHCELALTIPNTFAQFESSDFDAAFTDGYCVVGMVRISYAAAVKDGIPATLDPKQFAQYYMTLAEAEDPTLGIYDIYVTDDVPYYTYLKDGYFYMPTFYCSKYAYFVVMYTCAEERAAEYTDDFIKYASEAYFTE